MAGGKGASTPRARCELSGLPALTAAAASCRLSVSQASIAAGSAQLGSARLGVESTLQVLDCSLPQLAQPWPWPPVCFHCLCTALLDAALHCTARQRGEPRASRFVLRASCCLPRVACFLLPASCLVPRASCFITLRASQQQSLRLSLPRVTDSVCQSRQMPPPPLPPPAPSRAGASAAGEGILSAAAARADS